MNTPTPWTDNARLLLDEWFRRQIPRWRAEGADPDEVQADLRRDLEQRFARHPGPVDEADLRRALEALAPGPVPAPEPAAATVPAAGTGAQRPRCARTARRAWNWFTRNLFWVVLWPLAVTGFELAANVCGSLFFNPLPTYWHVALVAACFPAAFLCWRHRRRQPSSPDAAQPAWLAAWRGGALAVSGYWALLQIPLLAVGTGAFGMGLFHTFGAALLVLPIFWLCALASAAPLLLWFGLLRTPGGGWRRPATLGGVAAGLGLLAVVEGPGYVARWGAATDDVAWVRRLGSERTLLHMCYEGSGGRGSLTDTTGFVTNLLHGRLSPRVTRTSEAEHSRRLFYQVTGTPFNSLPPPRDFLANSRTGAAFDEFDWDPDVGGDGVFACIRGLDLAGSRLDGHVDAASGLGYWEWTLDFHHETGLPREARMQVLLPPGGVVSRLTLWVNGSPQEAAFSGTAKVAAAYKAVAVAQRRDPVLVRWIGPDRVLAQCFPVPVNGDMKIRLGITAPLDGERRLFFPRFLEQNFGFRKGLATDLWVQGDTALRVDGVADGSAAGKWREVHGTLPVAAQASRHGCVSCLPATVPPVVWTRDRFAKAGEEILVRSPAPATAPAAPVRSLVLAVDTSAQLKPWQPAIVEAVARLRASGTDVALVAATDQGAAVANESMLQNLEFAGGRDNREALRLAIAEAGRRHSPVVVWLHGPQPVAFGSCDAILQLLERGFDPPRLCSLDLAGGPNRILEGIGRLAVPAGTGRVLDPADLQRNLEAAAAPVPAFTYSRVPEGQAPAGSKEVWDQLARWHAWETVRRETGTTTPRPETAALAARYQLVTPLSGAVVLETAEQYQRFGLDQIDANSAPAIPSVPEPSTSVLVGIGVLLALRRRRPAA